MVARTNDRAIAAGLNDRISARHVGIHELERLGDERFDGIYSNFGPLNCAPDLGAVSRTCAALLRPGGKLVVSVIGRVCPWEFVHYTLRGRHARARVRAAPGVVPINRKKHTVWAVD